MVDRRQVYSRLIGTNWFPATTQCRDNIQGMYVPHRDDGSNARLQPVPSPWPGTFMYPDQSPVPFGQFDANTVRKELEHIRELGFRNIRFMNGSFLAYLIHPEQYLENLGSIAAVSRQLGLTMTYTLWIGTANLNCMFSLENFMGSSGLELEKAAVRRATDQAHIVWPVPPDWNNTNPQPGPRWIRPLPGTHFHGHGWIEPDWILRLSGNGKVAQWPTTFHVRLVTRAASRLSVASNWLALINRYLADLERVLWRDNPGVLLSYDLYNEGDVGMGPIGGTPDPAGTLDLIAHCYKELVRIRGGPVDVTVGMASWRNVVPWYMALQQQGVRFAYASFHMLEVDATHPVSGMPTWWVNPAEWDSYVGHIKASIGMGLRDLPIVCSELYSPYNSKPLPGWWQTLLGHALGALTNWNVGWQIWNVLESNYFLDARIGTASLVPLDGLLVPQDPSHGVNQPIATLAVCKQTTSSPTFYARDMQALLARTGGRDPSTC
jgi:hypothetical protein